MVLVLIIGGGLGYFVLRAKTQREAVLAIERAGGQVWYRWPEFAESFPLIGFKTPPWPVRWLSRHLGPDYFDSVIRVYLGEGAGDAEMAHVARLSHLEVFYNNNSNVTDAGLLLLGDLPYLQFICVNINGSTTGTVTTLVPATGPTAPPVPVPSPPRVTGAFLRGLSGLSQLKRLQLEGIPIRDADLAGIGGLAQLEDLDLGDTGISDAALVHLRGLVGLTSLTLQDNPRITSAGLPNLGHLASLINIDLDRTRVRDLEPLAALVGCWNIKLAGTPITDASLAPLGRITHLINLYLADTAITGSGLAPLRDLTELRMINLERTKIADAEVATLLELPALGWLNLAETAVTDAGLDHLARSHRLQVLDLTGTAVTDAGIARLLGAVKLLGVNLEEERLTPGRRAAFLQVCPTLRFNEYSAR